ncbi:O-antigen ligase family protein [Arenibacter certesii]|uniref:O-antigen ligase-related domain-containing protein n=1 Tax=Arenibacter certesii TaxID=228955 RepID=A0A918MML0_9FLAO|nr:O-antigen ligase family protein [Arenibacter certesii]GGW38967.1 hypothetical protein GCM10007383_24680 [Arenibacter certesii]
MLKSRFRNLFTKYGFSLPVFIMAAAIPFNTSIGNLGIIGGFVYSLFVLYKHRNRKFPFDTFAFVFPIVFFLIILSSALTSNNINTGLKQVDKSLLMVLIAIPIIVLSNFNNNILPKTLKVFSFSTVLASSILIGYGLINVILGSATSILFFHNFAALYDQHPVYYALYLSLSAFVITHYYFGHKIILNKKSTLIPLVSLMILIGGLILSASKIVIYVFFILYFFQLFQIIKNTKAKLIAVILVFFVAMLTINVPIIKDRFTEGLQFDLEKFEPTNDIAKAKVFSRVDKENLSDLELRYLFNKIGIYHTIQDNRILFGYGIGDIQDYLDYYYLTYGLAPNWYEGFNLHNQYLQIFVGYGVFVFLFFLTYIIYSFYIALKNKDYIFIFHLLITSSVFVFESLLSRNKGIVFFIFFNTLFLINSKNNENSPSRNKRST